MPLTELDFSALPKSNRLDRIAEETAKGTNINFGYVNEARRTDAQNEINQGLVEAMPLFSIRGRFMLEVRRYALWKAVRSLLKGQWPAWIWQQTGSCVGASGGNMGIVTQGVEIFLKNEAEEYRWPWWLYTYGRSRFRGGISGEGEGSFGSAYSEACKLDGQFEIDPEGEPDLPDPVLQSGWAVCPASLEMKWSNGAKIASNWLTFGQKRRFKTSALMRSADDCIDALANGYAITQASNFGFSPMTPPIEGKGENQIRLVRRWNATWSHQTSVIEFWDHPDVGPIFGWLNNWGPTAHGTPAGDYPPGMVYITHDLMDQICKSRDGEVYAHSGHDGFPAREPLLRFEDFNPLHR